MLTPFINIIFAWLLDEALDVMMDTMKHSPWTNLDPLIINERQKYGTACLLLLLCVS